MTRAEILEAARKCTCGERDNEYGTPEDSFYAIAQLWNAYVAGAGVDWEFDELDVAVMLALLKIGRIAGGSMKEDNFVDLAGYAACAGEIAAIERIRSGEEETV